MWLTPFAGERAPGRRRLPSLRCSARSLRSRRLRCSVSPDAAGPVHRVGFGPNDSPSSNGCTPHVATANLVSSPDALIVWSVAGDAGTWVSPSTGCWSRHTGAPTGTGDVSTTECHSRPSVRSIISTTGVMGTSHPPVSTATNSPLRTDASTTSPSQTYSSDTALSSTAAYASSSVAGSSRVLVPPRCPVSSRKPVHEEQRAPRRTEHRGLPVTPLVDRRSGLEAGPQPGPHRVRVLHPPEGDAVLLPQGQISGERKPHQHGLQHVPRLDRRPPDPGPRTRGARAHGPDVRAPIRRLVRRGLRRNRRFDGRRFGSRRWQSRRWRGGRRRGGRRRGERRRGERRRGGRWRGGRCRGGRWRGGRWRGGRCRGGGGEGGDGEAGGAEGEGGEGGDGEAGGAEAGGAPGEVPRPEMAGQGVRKQRRLGWEGRCRGDRCRGCRVGEDRVGGG